MTPLVVPEDKNLAVSSKLSWYCSGKTGGVCERQKLLRARRRRIILFLIAIRYLI
jgi:hypothetical protein